MLQLTETFRSYFRLHFSSTEDGELLSPKYSTKTNFKVLFFLLLLNNKFLKLSPSKLKLFSTLTLAKSKIVGTKSIVDTGVCSIDFFGIFGPDIIKGILISVSYGCLLSHGKVNCPRMFL